MMLLLPAAVAATILGLGLAGAGPRTQAEAPDLPLVVNQVSYNPGESFGEFELRNDGRVPIIAWDTYMSFRFADGSESLRGRMIDAYEDAAGLPHAPPGNRVLKAGDTRRERFIVPRRKDGSVPEAVAVRVGAVILDGNRSLGEPALIAAIFSSRRINAEIWGEIATSLRAARTSARGDVEALQRAADALDSRGHPEQPFKGFVRGNLVLALSRAQRGEGEDPAEALKRFVEQAEQSAEAARKFATPALP